jgi:hypothetical protein
VLDGRIKREEHAAGRKEAGGQTAGRKEAGGQKPKPGAK